MPMNPTGMYFVGAGMGDEVPAGAVRAAADSAEGRPDCAGTAVGAQADATNTIPARSARTRRMSNILCDRLHEAFVVAPAQGRTNGG